MRLTTIWKTNRLYSSTWRCWRLVASQSRGIELLQVVWHGCRPTPGMATYVIQRIIAVRLAHWQVRVCRSLAAVAVTLPSFSRTVTEQIRRFAARRPTVTLYNTINQFSPEFPNWLGTVTKGFDVRLANRPLLFFDFRPLAQPWAPECPKVGRLASLASNPWISVAIFGIDLLS